MPGTTLVAVGIDDRTEQLLTNEGYSLENPGHASERVYERMNEAPCDALILGTKSHLDGGFVERLRRSRIDTPAIRIVDGPRNERWSHECANFLDSGGDDVIVGPPKPEEVSLSVRTVCRRARIEPDQIVHFEGSESHIHVNLTKRRAAVNDQALSATASEMWILFVLAAVPGAVSRAAFSSFIPDWHEFTEDSIDVLVCRLRKQLGHAASLLVTRRGTGYELVGRRA